MKIYDYDMLGLHFRVQNHLFDLLCQCHQNITFLMHFILSTSTSQHCTARHQSPLSYSIIFVLSL